MSNVYPHPKLPLFPKRLLPFAKGQSLSVAGVGNVSFESLTRSKLGDVAPEHQEAYIQGVTGWMKTLFFGRQKPRLAQLTLGLADDVKASDLVLNERAQAWMRNSALFKTGGAWRSCSLINESNGIFPAVGPRLFLALLLAAEAVRRSPRRSSKPKFLEGELQSLVIDVVHSKRTAEVVLRTHGWTGAGPCSLSTIAEDLGLTHERVRQLVRSGERSLKNHALRPGDLKCLRKAISTLAAGCPMSSQEASRLLVDQKICQSAFHSQGVLDASAFFNIPTGLECWSIDVGNPVQGTESTERSTFILTEVGFGHTLTSINKEMRKKLRVEGAIEIFEEAKNLQIKYGYDWRTTRFAFEISAEGAFSNKEKAWFISNQVSDRVKQIHSLLRWVGPKKSAEIKKICEQSKNFESNIPIKVLEAILLKSDLFDKNESFYTVKDQSFFNGFEEVRGENLIAKHLLENGGRSSRRSLRLFLSEKGVNPDDLSKYLKSSLLFLSEDKTIFWVGEKENNVSSEINPTMCFK